MADPILFQSANRFLAASPSGDFALYGAQPTVQITAAAPASQTMDQASAPATTGDAAPAVISDSQDAPSYGRPTDIGGGQDSHGSSGLPPTSFQPAPTAEPIESVPTTPLNPFDLRPITLTQLENGAAPAPRHDAAQDEGGPALSHAGDMPAAFATPVLAGIAPIVGEPVGTVIGLAEPVVGPAAALVGDTVNTVVGIVGPMAGTVEEVVGGTVGTVAGVAEPTLDSVTGMLGGLTGAVDGVDDLVGNALSGAAPALDGAAAPLLTTLGEVGQTVTGAAGDAPVTDLLGSDPAGGIATLVNLVNVTDLLDLRDAGAPGDSGPIDASDPVSGLLDTLTTDLSDTPHHDDSAPDHETGGGGILPVTPTLPVQPPLGDLLGGHHDDAGLGLGLGG